MNRIRRNLGWLATAALVGAALIAPASVAGTQPDPSHKVTICHRTNSVTNPYNRITVDEASVDGDAGNDNGKGDHLLNHAGDAFDFSADPDVKYPTPRNGDQWGDIIPPFYEDGVTLTGYPTLNWDATGQAIFYAGCAQPVEPESQPVESESLPAESESAPVESESLPAESPSGSVEAETGTPTPSGSVEAETGTPGQGNTPPPTDAIGGTSSPSGSGWQLVLVALAAILATALIFTPVSRRPRR